MTELPDNSSKSRWQSRGFVGPLVAAVCTIAVTSGVPDLPAHLGFENQEVLVDLILKGGAVIGALLGAYGRLKAKHTLK
jgi:hypothetical protein